MAVETLQVKIFGRVQGVFFRATLKKMANDLDLTGYVTNNHDGTVTMRAQGAKSRLQQLLEKCYSGPDSAEVSKVEHDWTTSTVTYPSFIIKY